MSNYGPQDSWVTEQLTSDSSQYGDLIGAFTVASGPLTNHQPLQVIVEAYITAGYYYAISKDYRRRATNGERLEAQLCEDYLEALVKGLDKAIMATMHLGKQERYGG